MKTNTTILIASERIVGWVEGNYSRVGNMEYGRRDKDGILHVCEIASPYLCPRREEEEIRERYPKYEI